MQGSGRTQAELLKELETFRIRVAELEECEIERKQVEEALRREKETAQQYLDIVGVMLVGIDANEKVTLVNRKGCELLGYKEEEITFKNWFDNFLPERVREEVRAVFADLVAGQIEPVTYFEKPILTKSGEERIIAWHNAVLKDRGGTVVSVLGSGTDITERKRAEEALRRTEERYRLHFENVRDVIYLTDLDLRIRDISPSVEVVLGYRPEEIIGKRIDELNVLAPEYYKQAISKTMRVLAGEQLGFTEYEFIAKDGTRKIGEVRGAPLLKKGGVVGVISVARDITERKQVEKELADYRDRLEEMVEKRTAELKATNVQLQREIAERKQVEEALRVSESRYRHLSESLEQTVEQKVEELQQAQSLAVIGQMVSVVAHDVRNPLQNIKMGIDAMHKAIGNEEEKLEILEEIDHGITLLNEIVGELLEYAKPVKLQYSWCSVHDIVSRALRTLGHKLGNIRTDVKLEQGDKKILVDTVRFGAALVNLISNAADAMPGGGNLTILSQFSSDEGTSVLKLSITDSGCGINQESLERIQEPFYTSKIHGTGLGIPICKRIIEAHKGRLNIKSKIKEGTTIEIVLPVSEP